jgi:hypothetical protein
MIVSEASLEDPSGWLVSSTLRDPVHSIEQLIAGGIYDLRGTIRIEKEDKVVDVSLHEDETPEQAHHRMWRDLSAMPDGPWLSDIGGSSLLELISFGIKTNTVDAVESVLGFESSDGKAHRGRGRSNG